MVLHGGVQTKQNPVDQKRSSPRGKRPRQRIVYAQIFAKGIPRANNFKINYTAAYRSRVFGTGVSIGSDDSILTPA